MALDGSCRTQQAGTVPERFQEAIKKEGDGFVAIHGMLERLEASHWRDLFSKAITPLADDESLALLERDGRTWLIARRTTLFELTPSGLRLAGACDQLPGAFFADRVPLHLL